MSQIRTKSPRVIIYAIIIIPTIFLLALPISFVPGIVLYHEILEYVYPNYHRPLDFPPEYQVQHWYRAIDLEGIWEQTISNSILQLIILFFLPVTILLAVIKYYTGYLTKLTVLVTTVLLPIVFMVIMLIILYFCGFTYFCGFVYEIFFA